jgi:hypothetical protein
VALSPVHSPLVSEGFVKKIPIKILNLFVELQTDLAVRSAKVRHTVSRTDRSDDWGEMQCVGRYRQALQVRLPVPLCV